MSAPRSKRSLAPRLTDALAVRPVLVSDLSAPAAVGLEGRAFRAFVRDRGIAHAMVGKRMLVRASDLEDALRGIAAPAPEPDGEAEPTREQMLHAVGAA